MQNTKGPNIGPRAPKNQRRNDENGKEDRPGLGNSLPGALLLGHEAVERLWKRKWRSDQTPPASCTARRGSIDANKDRTLRVAAGRLSRVEPGTSDGAGRSIDCGASGRGAKAFHSGPPRPKTNECTRLGNAFHSIPPNAPRFPKPVTLGPVEGRWGVWVGSRHEGTSSADFAVLTHAPDQRSRHPGVEPVHIYTRLIQQLSKNPSPFSTPFQTRPFAARRRASRRRFAIEGRVALSHTRRPKERSAIDRRAITQEVRLHRDA
uniref:Uncharacterized protein n=1 Tax=Steinernema glaseri TaxID=37863 RepID=A0A1I7ZMJ9_9BILA